MLVQSFHSKLDSDGPFQGHIIEEIKMVASYFCIVEGDARKKSKSKKVCFYCTYILSEIS